ncbi:MAG: nicotinamide riboside transporter PnuC [Haliea sp.]|nr:MAG: nicotinamide riboside transporter PnuC [Haliea sp.]
MPEVLFAEAFTLWGSPATWFELVAVCIALVMVGCNIREIHWGWPLAAISSVMYFMLFWRSRIYGDAALQVAFAVLALWGWAQWLRGVRPDGSALKVARLSRNGVLLVVAACAVLWPAIGLFLKTYTDTDVPWWDAFPTAVSLVGQFLLARKYIENWAVWIAVNIVSVGLFAYKGLWLTVGLYTVFIVLSVVGWRAWRARLA